MNDFVEIEYLCLRNGRFDLVCIPVLLLNKHGHIQGYQASSERLGKLKATTQNPAGRMPALRESAMVTKEELIDFACEITGRNVEDLSTDQMQKLMNIMQHLAECSLDEIKSFGQLCAIRSDIDAAVTAGTGDFVTLSLTKEQCAFLLALIDREIREHA
jgi:hypothetical protein